MGHIAMGRRCGIDTERITLRALGGIAHLEAPAQSPRDEIRIALAGPVTHLAWMAALYPLTWSLESAHGGENWFWLLHGFARLQLALMTFNLLPVYPADGGVTLRGLLSLRMHSTRASHHTAIVGYVGNAAFIVLGFLAWTELADPLAFGPFGFLLAWLGIAGLQRCHRLQLEAKYGDVYGDHDPFQKTLLASQAAMRQVDDEERESRRAAREKRERLQAAMDRLLDRINEAGGVEKLSARERKELERTSRELSQGD
jgi:Zn-dependent protease